MTSLEAYLAARYDARLEARFEARFEQVASERKARVASERKIRETTRLQMIAARQAEVRDTLAKRNTRASMLGLILECVEGIKPADNVPGCWPLACQHRPLSEGGPFAQTSNIEAEVMHMVASYADGLGDLDPKYYANICCLHEIEPEAVLRPLCVDLLAEIFACQTPKVRELLANIKLLYASTHLGLRENAGRSEICHTLTMMFERRVIYQVGPASEDICMRAESVTRAGTASDVHATPVACYVPPIVCHAYCAAEQDAAVTEASQRAATEGPACRN